MAFGGNALFQLVAFGLPATGGAEAPIPIHVVFDAPADCSTGEAFYEGVRSRTDRVRRAQTGEAGTELRVRVTRTSGKIHGELNLTAERGQSDRRVVDGESCDEVVEALSLTAALALDPAARIAPDPAPPKPAAPQPCAPAAPCPPPPPPPPAAAHGFGLALYAEARAARAVAPYWGFGGEFGASVTPLAWTPNGPSFGVGVLHLENDWLASPANASAELTALVVDVCPLGVELAPGVRFEPCASMKGGWIWARGVGLDRPAWAVRSFWSLGAELGAEVALFGGLAARGGVGLDIPLVKRRFVVGRPPRPAAETPSLVPGASLGLSYHFQ